MLPNLAVHGCVRRLDLLDHGALGVEEVGLVRVDPDQFDVVLRLPETPGEPCEPVGSWVEDSDNGVGGGHGRSFQAPFSERVGLE